MNCLLMVKEIEATGKTNAEKKLRWKPNYNFFCCIILTMCYCFSFKSGCTYTLASDTIDNTFQVQTSARNCSAGSCHMDIILYIGDKRYQLAVNGKSLSDI